MKLNALLKIHDAHLSPIGLEESLGDGFLISKNPIFRRVREQTIQAKFKFTSNRFANYDTLALTQLPAILSQRKIPYYDNCSPLREVEKKAPGIFSFSDLPPLRKNYHFHESAHALAHAFAPSIVALKKNQNKLQKEQAYVFSTLREESFANACESIANAYSTDDLHDEFLYQNLYIIEKKSFRLLLRRTIQHFGFAFVFQLIYFSFLHANFQDAKDPSASLVRVLRLLFRNQPHQIAHLTDQDLKKFARIYQGGLDLDPEFTLRTNRFCLKLGGVRSDWQRVFDFDFLKAFETGSDCQTTLNDLTRAITP